MAALPQTSFDRAAAEYVRVMARRRGITQAELRSRAGIKEATMSNYWRDRTSMTLGTFRTILVVLEVEPADAFAEIDRIQASLFKSSLTS